MLVLLFGERTGTQESNRAAVWKAVQTLEQNQMPIQSHPKKILYSSWMPILLTIAAVHTLTQYLGRVTTLTRLLTHKPACKGLAAAMQCME